MGDERKGKTYSHCQRSSELELEYSSGGSPLRVEVSSSKDASSVNSTAVTRKRKTGGIDEA